MISVWEELALLNRMHHDSALISIPNLMLSNTMIWLLEAQGPCDACLPLVVHDASNMHVGG